MKNKKRIGIILLAGLFLASCGSNEETSNLSGEEKKSVEKIDEVAAVGYIKQANDSVLDMAEKMPQYPGGVQALMSYLSKNIEYPETAQKEKIEGRVVIQFIVDKEGNIHSSKVVRNLSPDLDAEALSVVSAMPKWEPGMQDGKAVSVKYTIPIVFRLGTESAKKAQ